MTVISKGKQFALAVAIICSSFIPNSFAQPYGSDAGHFYVEGVADTNGPFADQPIRIFGNEGKVTIIRDTTNEMALVKMTMTTASCYDRVPTICLNGVVYSVKNTDNPDVGDVVRLNIDTSGKKQIIAFLTGQLKGSSISINPNENQASENPDIQKLVFISEKGDQPNRSNMYEDDGMIKAIQMTQQFAVNHPTFAFDGIQQSLDVNLVSMIQSKVPVYIVQVSFDSEHPGYGNRSGQALKDVTTHHVMKVMVSDYGIGSAIIDGLWDEFNQTWKK